MFNEVISSKGQSMGKAGGKGRNEKKIVLSFRFREQCATFGKKTG